jgi:tetratricopeptide (TPR) repeat protein
VRRLVLSVALLLSACIAHEKVADQAALTGDWKTAEREYAQALRDGPKDKAAVQAKWQDARARAINASQRKAQACMVGQDWECALAEAQYVLALDPGDAQMAAVRRDAAREAARARLRRAGDALDAGQLPQAMELTESARAATDDAGVQAEVRRFIPAVTRAAISDADRFRAARQYPQAIDLLARAARLDPALAPRLDAVRGEYESWKDAEAERLTREGDGLLSAHRFADARARYDQALSIRPQSRAAPLSQYAGLLAEGEEAIAHRDFARAERLYRDAAQSPVDDGYARAALERVQLRTWAVQVKFVKVRPGGPQGPLVVTLRLPDGRSVQTLPQRSGRFTRLDAIFVVPTNAYDDRPVTARVFRLPEREGSDERPWDLGTVTFPLSDLVARGALSLDGGVVDELRFEASPTPFPAGDLRGLVPVPDAPLPPPPPPPPRRK